MSHRHSLSLWSFLLVAGLVAPAFAEEPATVPAKPQSKPEPAKRTHAKATGVPTAEPEIVNTAYGDWALRCRKEESKKADDKDAKDAASARTCEISQTIEARDRSGPIAKLSIGRPGGKGALYAIVILPNNISFPSSVHIRSDEKDIWGVRLDWVRCIPGGCFAQTQLADATVKYWHDLHTMGQIVFTDSSGDSISLDMSFRGFGEALDALNKGS